VNKKKLVLKMEVILSRFPIPFSFLSLLY